MGSRSPRTVGNPGDRAAGEGAAGSRKQPGIASAKPGPPGVAGARRPDRHPVAAVTYFYPQFVAISQTFVLVTSPRTSGSAPPRQGGRPMRWSWPAFWSVSPSPTCPALVVTSRRRASRPPVRSEMNAGWGQAGTGCWASVWVCTRCGCVMSGPDCPWGPAFAGLDTAQARGAGASPPVRGVCAASSRGHRRQRQPTVSTASAIPVLGCLLATCRTP
jgi:hypothetical protein